MKTVIFLASIIIGVAVAEHGDDGENENVNYKFEYGVHDPHTHDHKSHYEHRDGKHVVGAYTLQEADGTFRIVKYKSGPRTGFEAVVERVGHAQHPVHGAGARNGGSAGHGTDSEHGGSASHGADSGHGGSAGHGADSGNGGVGGTSYVAKNPGATKDTMDMCINPMKLL